MALARSIPAPDGCRPQRVFTGDLALTDLPAQEGKHFCPDATGVSFIHVDADPSRPNPDAMETEVDELLKTVGAVLGGADDGEAIDEVVPRRRVGVENELAGCCAGHADDAATWVSQH